MSVHVCDSLCVCVSARFYCCCLVLTTHLVHIPRHIYEKESKLRPVFTLLQVHSGSRSARSHLHVCALLRACEGRSVGSFRPFFFSPRSAPRVGRSGHSDPNLFRRAPRGGSVSRAARCRSTQNRQKSRPGVGRSRTQIILSTSHRHAPTLVIIHMYSRSYDSDLSL